MNDFERDDKWQRQMRDKILAPGFYRSYATNGRYVFIDKGRLASILQKRYAVDTIVQGRAGSAVCIEEKIVRWPGYRYRDICLETHSCTKPGHESPGWMEYGEADYLLYCFAQENDDLECYLINFPELKTWFKPANFPTFGPLKTLNASMGRKVPVALIRQKIPTWRRYVPSPSRGSRFDAAAKLMAGLDAVE